MARHNLPSLESGHSNFGGAAMDPPVPSPSPGAVPSYIRRAENNTALNSSGRSVTFDEPEDFTPKRSYRKTGVHEDGIPDFKELGVRDETTGNNVYAAPGAKYGISTPTTAEGAKKKKFRVVKESVPGTMYDGNNRAENKKTMNINGNNFACSSPFGFSDPQTPVNGGHVQQWSERTPDGGLKTTKITTHQTKVPAYVPPATTTTTTTRTERRTMQPGGVFQTVTFPGTTTVTTPVVTPPTPAGGYTTTTRTTYTGPAYAAPTTPMTPAAPTTPRGEPNTKHPYAHPDPMTMHNTPVVIPGRQPVISTPQLNGQPIMTPPHLDIPQQPYYGAPMMTPYGMPMMTPPYGAPMMPGPMPEMPPKKVKKVKDIFIDGWIQKRGPTFGSEYKTRWCVLENGILKYFKKQQEKGEDADGDKEKGEIPIEASTEIRLFTDKHATFEARTQRMKNPCGFEIYQGKGARTYYFDAGTREKLKAWVRALEDVIESKIEAERRS